RAVNEMPEAYKLDLHSGFDKFGGGNFDEIYRRTELIRVGEVDVRVPSAEDHLRVLSIHMLREGAWRPLWLCDVAAAVESRPEGFDWNHCLGRNKRWANWVFCALRLARELLGADISGTPAGAYIKPLPRWLVPVILKEWEKLSPSMRQRHRAPMASYWYYRSGILMGFRNRWPNPIEATISVKGLFNGLPRFPFQLGSYLARSVQFASRVTKNSRQ
ncbi:MAG TPA: nucleotidyltransferase family protein, partial [Pyrinomonadaceae bacterium]|nr:nucleotidyltransferase family protein [Pyrinomonadaceae bacterium]